MTLAEARDQKLATARKNLKMVVVALLTLAIERMIDMITSLAANNWLVEVATNNCCDICTNKTKDNK